ncbi:uncharacterized protein L3040_004191 [Drepanopeziza brunnea f. sp. 'multigermtubi']|uniref:uncharacterized protein n=1 Tax=Drepanopeziza brunnea f. sp. 'multigermtubi' TaxID=698441 RepID=UPI00239845B6|nr:hypothetical protein L3040_004191 [Drepanopeziza brunnea f. sp. 'multigermtubi']
MENDHHQLVHENGDFGNNGGWMDINQNYNLSSQHQSPVYENGVFAFTQPFQHDALSTEQSFTQQRMPIPQHSPPHTSPQLLLPLIMPSHPTWPSMLTNPATYPTPPVAIPATAPPLSKGNGKKLPAIHAAPTPRKTLTDSDRRRMCQYHEENPTIKQTDIGAMFGVERSTVSKVLRQKEKFLFPEDRNLSPVKRAKGSKYPDIERTLSNWVRKSQQQGQLLTDDDIKQKARYFAANIHPNADSHLKTNSAAWLEKFKQKNKLGGAKLTRRASETNISDSGSLNPESAGPSSASQTPNGISPKSPSGLPSPSPVSATKSEEDLKSDNMDEYFAKENGGYRHSNSRSTTSLSSAFTDTAPSSFSGGPTSPTTPFAFSSDQGGSWLPSQQALLSLPPGNGFQRPRSQTFPTLGIDPSFISSQNDEPLTPKYNVPVTSPSSALDSPIHEMPHPFGMDSAISSPPLHSLHHSSSNGSMAPPQPGTPITGLISPPGSSAPGSPTQDDARRALDTLLNFISQAPSGLVDRDEYLTVLKLTERLRLQSSGALPGGLHRIAEQDCELTAPKMEQSMSAGC